MCSVSLVDGKICNDQVLHVMPGLACSWQDYPLPTGVAKHHVCNANLMKNGADFAVFVNTAQEFDGSDSGARPDEAVSWGKIRADAEPVKVYGDATILFPLLVSQTFAVARESHTE